MEKALKQQIGFQLYFATKATALGPVFCVYKMCYPETDRWYHPVLKLTTTQATQRPSPPVCPAAAPPASLPYMWDNQLSNGLST